MYKEKSIGGGIISCSRRKLENVEFEEARAMQSTEFDVK